MTPGTHCTCGDGCLTYGACLRNKGIGVMYCRSAAGYDYSKHLALKRELALYADARRQGVQPSGTQTHQTLAAMEISQRTGKAYDAGKAPDVIS